MIPIRWPVLLGLGVLPVVSSVLHNSSIVGFVVLAGVGYVTYLLLTALKQWADSVSSVAKTGGGIFRAKPEELIESPDKRIFWFAGNDETSFVWPAELGQVHPRYDNRFCVNRIADPVIEPGRVILTLTYSEQP